jgi:2-polyprenyl-3-methyl-5-hydroxy-6-metoxy-1,4-benzoquinol methylase
MITQMVELDEKSLVLDYGCGIGRIAKDLIKKTGCNVIGVDISPTMLGFAYPYVNSSNFSAISPSTFGYLIDKHNLRFDLAICVWVLQHCLDPEHDVAQIRTAMKDKGKLFVVNNIKRVVPTLERGWVDDLVDVDKVIKYSNFQELAHGQLNPKVVPDVLHKNAFWALYNA